MRDHGSGNDSRKQRAAESSKAHAKSVGAAHGLRRENIGGRNKEICHPGLMRRGGQAKQQDRELRVLDHHAQRARRHDHRAKQHGHLARLADGPPALHQETGNNASQQGAHRRNAIHNHQRRAALLRRKVAHVRQVRRQPEQIKPPHGIGEEFRQAVAPGLLVLHHFADR